VFQNTFSNPWQIAHQLRTQGLYIGGNTQTHEPYFLPLQDLFSHAVIWGPPGKGKTNLLLTSCFANLIHIPNATVILGIQKGDAGAQARDLVIQSGMLKRLIIFDPSDQEYVCGFNPLKPNGLTIATHAKQVRESLLAGWNQFNADQTPLLARFLFLSLYIARELELTLASALAVLRDAQFRHRVIPQITNPHLQDALRAFDSLPSRQQSEQVMSAVNRLESFVLDPGISHILNAQENTLDFAEVLKQKQIVILNLELYRPFRPADCSLLSKLLVNSLISSVFERPKNKRSPVFLLLDEATWVSEDLAVATQLGRELKLSVILSHQHPNQLLLENGDTKLRDAIMECTRTKIVFGGLSTKILRELTPEMLLDQYDPWTIKDELTSLELDPSEATRTSRTTSRSRSKGKSHSASSTEGETHSDAFTSGKTSGRAFGLHQGKGKSRAQGQAHTIMRGTAEARGSAHAFGASWGGSRGRALGSGSGMTVLPDGQVLTTGTDQTTTSDMDFSGESFSDLESELSSVSEGEAETHSNQESEQETDGTSWALQQGSQESTTQGTATTTTEGTTEGESEEESWGESKTIAPFYDYNKKRVVSSRTFLTEPEFLTLGLQKIQQLPIGHCIVKTANRPAVFLHIPLFTPPHLSTQTKQRARERIFSQSSYRRTADIQPPPLLTQEEEELIIEED
jgi:hypothetical protein